MMIQLNKDAFHMDSSGKPGLPVARGGQISHIREGWTAKRCSAMQRYAAENVKAGQLQILALSSEID